MSDYCNDQPEPQLNNKAAHLFDHIEIVANLTLGSYLNVPGLQHETPLFLGQYIDNHGVVEPITMVYWCARAGSGWPSVSESLQ